VRRQPEPKKVERDERDDLIFHWPWLHFTSHPDFALELLGGLRDHRLSRNWSNSAWSTDNLIHSAMVLAEGVSCIVRWKAKALGWNQELWIEKAAHITFPLTPCLCCYCLGAVDHSTTKTFVWVGGGSSPHPVNAIEQEDDVSYCNRLLMPPTRAPT